MSNPQKRIRIIVPKGRENYPLSANGTRVFLGDQEIAGITAIQLIGDTYTPWQAVVTFGTIEVIDAAD